MSVINIMITDDHSMIREGLKQLLELEGEFNVVCEASDGVECLEKLKVVKPEVLLLDINMPNVNGYDVLKFMQTNNFFQKIKVAIITGTDSKEVLENIKGYPVVALLEKPFNENSVRKVVDMLLNKN